MSGLSNIQRVYLAGIGGIGMSALARYFHSLGVKVEGYDRTQTEITSRLMEEGINIHFDDDVNLICDDFKNVPGTLVIYTPAIPKDHRELNYFLKKGFEVLKRSQALGRIAADMHCIAVAGTHGKTTISTMIAHLLHEADVPCNAFLGGISKNLDSNLLLHKNANKVVVEADEYDRSFLALFPEIAVVSSADADHLDIYGDHNSLKESFGSFVSQIKRNGCLILKKGVEIPVTENTEILTYSLDEEADFYALNIKNTRFRYRFDLRTPDGMIKNLNLGVYGRVNLENAVAALAVAVKLGVDSDKLRKGLENYKGVWRRFDVQIDREDLIFIDDYAHHPAEIKAFVGSVKEALPGKRICGVFQPHLYSRTRDFALGFAESLSMLHDVVLLDIYPAREKPIEGVSSELILKQLKNMGERRLSSKDELINTIDSLHPEVLLTMGAGDIDKLVKPLKSHLEVA